MTSAPVLAVIFAILVAFTVGYRAPGEPPQPLGLTRFPRGASMADLSRPNERAAAALSDFQIDLATPAPLSDEGLSTLGSDPPPPPDMTETPPVPVAPPPPDVAVVFRARLSALVTQGDGGLAALIANPEGRSRLLRVGDAFDGTWRLEALTSNDAVLWDGRHRRHVTFYGAVAGASEL